MVSFIFLCKREILIMNNRLKDTGYVQTVTSNKIAAVTVTVYELFLKANLVLISYF